MARARNIKPGFYKNEELAECSVWARLLFPGLWMLADREGRLEDRPKRIKAELFPFDSVDVDKLLNELERGGFLTRYRNDDGSFIQISKFSEHQSPHYSEKPSSIKPPEFPENSRNSTTIKKQDSEKPPVIKRGSQPPDSLNPDSLNPETVISAVVTETTAAPEPPAETTPAEAGKPPPAVAAAVDALRVGLAAGTEQHERAGELWAVLAANGCKGTASHPTVIEMVRDGVSVEELRKAIAKARQSKEGQLSPAYLAAIIEDMRSNPAKSNGKSAAWATDERATEAKARELGLWPAKANESWDALRGRIRAKLATAAEGAVR